MLAKTSGSYAKEPKAGEYDDNLQAKPTTTKSKITNTGGAFGNQNQNQNDDTNQIEKDEKEEKIANANKKKIGRQNVEDVQVRVKNYLEQLQSIRQPPALASIIPKT